MGSQRSREGRGERSNDASASTDAGLRREQTSRPSINRLEEVRRRVVAEREQQGLPEFIEDEAILDKIVDILTLGVDHGEDNRGEDNCVL